MAHAAVVQAITSRRAVRAFLPEPIAHSRIEALLALAARAPSGSNIQPWQVDVLSGAARERLSAAVLAAAAAGGAQHTEPWPYYPRTWTEPYLSRRRALGSALYRALGIDHADRARRQAQAWRNYRFFDAPVALVFSIDAELEQGSWLDYGAFVQTLMIAARADALDTCAQVALNPYHRVVAACLDWPAGRRMIGSLALGRADPQAPENRLDTPREPVAAFTRFHA